MGNGRPTGKGKPKMRYHFWRWVISNCLPRYVIRRGVVFYAFSEADAFMYGDIPHAPVYAVRKSGRTDEKYEGVIYPETASTNTDQGDMGGISRCRFAYSLGQLRHSCAGPEGRHRVNPDG